MSKKHESVSNKKSCMIYQDILKFLQVKSYIDTSPMPANSHFHPTSNNQCLILFSSLTLSEEDKHLLLDREYSILQTGDPAFTHYAGGLYGASLVIFHILENEVD